MKNLRVVYSVTYECDVPVEDGQDIQDAIQDIDIPEGGKNDSVYCLDSFDVVEVYDPEEGK
jgi:hypothetical protein